MERKNNDDIHCNHYRLNALCHIFIGLPWQCVGKNTPRTERDKPEDGKIGRGDIMQKGLNEMFLLEQALLRRKIPLVLRMIPRIMGVAAGRAFKKIESDVLAREGNQ